MGRAGQGRPSKPTALKLLHGDRKDRVNTREPVPVGEVVAPATLSKGAREVWNRLAPDLIAKQVLTAWDVDDFAAFCDAADRRRRSAVALDKAGEVVEVPVLNRDGEEVGTRWVTSPWWQIWKGANEAMLRFGARFGLSPSDRASLKVGGDEPRSDKGRLLSGP